VKTIWIRNAVSVARRIWIRITRGCVGVRLEFASRETRESETIQKRIEERKDGRVRMSSRQL